MNKKALYESIMSGISRSLHDIALNEMASQKNPDDVFMKIYKDAIKEHKNKGEKSFEINFFRLWEKYLENKKEGQLWNNDEDEFVKYVTRKKLWNLSISGYTVKIQREGCIGRLTWDAPLLVFSVLYLAQPCREFDKLNKMLEKYDCKKINNDFLGYQYVSGKRDDIFDTRNVNYLCHMPNKCNEITEWIKDNMTPSKKLEIDTLIKIDRGEDEYLYRSETEWEGTQYGRISFEITRNYKSLAKRTFDLRW